MNLNGQVLKLGFLIIIVSLCIVLVISTIDFMMAKMTLDSYKGLVELLGIPTIIGMIVQSFIHQNVQDKATESSDKKAV